MVLLALAYIVTTVFLLWRLRVLSRLPKSEPVSPQKQDALGTLAGGIAHDFNNILASILGFGVLLEEDLATQPELHMMASQITTAARRGQEVVAQLMSYSRNTLGAGEQMIQPVCLDALLKESIQLMKPCLRASTQVSYINNASDSVIMANATQIGQVILNLCINADHAIGIKTGAISITLDNLNLKTSLGKQDAVVQFDFVIPSAYAAGCLKSCSMRSSTDVSALVMILNQP